MKEIIVSNCEKSFILNAITEGTVSIVVKSLINVNLYIFDSLNGGFTVFLNLILSLIFQ